MKITQEAIEKMSNAEGRMALMKALDISEFWARRLLTTNKDNGPLTTAIALRSFEQVTKLKQKDILTEDKPQKA